MIRDFNKLIADGKFKLILPQQIEDEFIRNKNGKSAIYGDHILNFQKGLEVEFKVPYLIKSTKKIEQIRNTVKKLKSLKEKAVDDYKSRVFNPRSKINQQLRKLFSQAHRPNETDVILQRAWFRTLRGNPPRKDNSSFGDAIIWETILDQCIDDDLILISGDGDFESEINNGDIHELLKTEWTNKSNKKLILYTELGLFINQQSKNKKKSINKETIEEERRLNLIFTGSASTGTSLLENQSEYNGIKLSQSLGIPDGLLNIKNTCACCGAEIHGINLYGPLGSNRCDNCRGYFSSGLTCSKCGRHFHRDSIGIITTSFGNSICDLCQNFI